ncbi:CGNR zinc finger domain-containing protein [Bailinhaonella thermotolerans]|uniref:Zf-CGNR multi-domain protein n=1 Tax=Bailinhaonella thermotolerans TaxID=1070861 RepID=A0A3A4AE38_9ACTN|nr:CGNR zinc finger domain-containing protein [Bailinhaonella thermotolerans]RJL26559.1 zf-CGNR multi-domain protein [Bailinhaonella thermotolerans]
MRAAELLRDFVNTYDVEEDEESLGTPEALAGWLGARGLGGDAGSGAGAEFASGAAAECAVGPRELADAVALREGLRRVMRCHHDRVECSDAGLEDVLSRLPVRVSLADGPRLVPATDGPGAGLAALAAAIAEARADGTWDRLKVCAESTCQWAFLDLSKNRSRSWCSMRVCGNRTKTRAYRARRAGG